MQDGSHANTVSFSFHQFPFGFFVLYRLLNRWLPISGCQDQKYRNQKHEQENAHAQNNMVFFAGAAVLKANQQQNNAISADGTAQEICVRKKTGRCDPQAGGKTARIGCRSESVHETGIWYLRVSAEAFDTPRPLRGDMALLHRMLYNLVSNSIVHNPNGCEIELSVSAEGNCCVFSVVDTGCGMEERQIEKLNADKSIGSIQPGDRQEEHGLGLKIVCQIAKAHQGKAVFSKNVPRGLCVKVEIAGN